jgi:carboxymethylenebutenolidase
VAREDISIDTADGQCRTSVFTPAGGGPWPGVIFFMDGVGIRPVLGTMAQRLADAGYVVLLPDLYYRAGAYDPIDVGALFASEDGRAALAPFRGSTDNRRAAEDANAFLDYLQARRDVAGTKVGTTGYCMGGAISLTVAATAADRIGAAASFHGGLLATDDEQSPHRLVDRIRARVYVGAADNDGTYPPAMAARFVEALMEAHVEHRHDLYAGAAHGWTMSDFPIYDEDAAERHWRELVALFDATLR